MRKFIPLLMLVGAVVIGLAFGFGVNPAVEKNDMNCNIKVSVHNPMKETCTVVLYWIDHNIQEYGDSPFPRHMAEIPPGCFSEISKDFRLCQGKYCVLWWKSDVRYNHMEFTISGPDVKNVLITPNRITFS